MENFDKYIGQIFDRRYKINRIIGIGGMAIVFEAHDMVMNRTVAVKMLKDEIANDKQAVKRFINESKAIAMLSHPNIIPIYDISVKEDLKYIVMERVEGITLKNYMSKKGVLPLNEVLHYADQILKALEHAHSKGIIHRDIKPQNILLMKNGKIKVTDFGIARLPNAETVTMTDKAIGTVYYISPEQASGRKIDARSDIYSLGVMMYEMATGCLPFTADSPVSVALMQVNDKPRRPSEIVPEISTGLEQIILGAMEKEPELRFQTAGQFRRYVTQLSSNPDFVFKTVVKKSSASSDPDDGNDGGKSQSHTMFPIILGVSLALFIALGISAYYLISQFLFGNNGPSTITVPTLVGAVYNESLEDQFNPDIYRITINEVNNDNYPKGTIIEQEPRGGEKRKVQEKKQYCEITLTVSAGPETIVMPDFVFKNYLTVEIELRKLGLNCEIKKIESSTVDIGYVIKTSPAAGEEIKTGSTVTVYSSIGASYTTVPVPNCKGKTPAEAYKLLLSSTGALMFEIGESTYAYSTDYAAGEIISQSKEPGTSVPKGTKISFVISMGPAYTPPVETQPEEPENPFENFYGNEEDQNKDPASIFDYLNR